MRIANSTVPQQTYPNFDSQWFFGQPSPFGVTSQKVAAETRNPSSRHFRKLAKSYPSDAAKARRYCHLLSSARKEGTAAVFVVLEVDESELSLVTAARNPDAGNDEIFERR